ncbi:ABC transporter ATP-binding protein [Legionella nagasakiensis]|uniref:ABC transporter ATP-binding protein n=1 Tax=Legionella nagasakiensis TaxID=535290 RepID=UPI0013EF5DDA|nr:ABC transporter ATP-binding protein [Legionella nagasakiensis]
MSLHEKEAIVFQNISKIYRLYSNKWQMVKDALGFKVKGNVQEFYALKNINLTIRKGERVGIIGRNGAGKSTLLKLITGNFRQSNGNLYINGNVQALMNTGVGFHPEFTGLENIKASLLYNGLSNNQLSSAIEDIIDFVELGEFLEQPFKTYSLGMQSRLHFAVATAIRPEILIVDEVLGAGDAYFSAKSAERMKKLTNSGCTLLLVSHATAQILQFCEKAIWLECGEKIKEGTALEVVKIYEEYTKKLELEAKEKNTNKISSSTSSSKIIQSKWLREKILRDVLSIVDDSNHNKETGCNVTHGGLSRWKPTAEGLCITSVNVLDQNEQPCFVLNPGKNLTFNIEFEALQSDGYNCYFVIMIFNAEGKTITRHRSPLYQLNLNRGERYQAKLVYEKILFGAGHYVFSAAIFKHFGENAEYYDLLSRSFEFNISSYDDDPSLFYHPAIWHDKIIELSSVDTKDDLITMMN